MQCYTILALVAMCKQAIGVRNKLTMEDANNRTMEQATLGNTCCCKTVDKAEECEAPRKFFEGTEHNYCCKFKRGGCGGLSGYKKSSHAVFQYLTTESQKLAHSEIGMCQLSCCCKAVDDISECTNPIAKFNPGKSRIDTTGYCCKLRQHYRCDAHRGYKIPAKLGFNRLSESTRADLQSAAGMCITDNGGVHQCNAHEDCEGAQACKNRPGQHDPWLSRQCSTDTTCEEVLDGISWVFVVTSSGGGGHKSAAQEVSQRINKAVRSKLDQMWKHCDTNKAGIRQRIHQLEAWYKRTADDEQHRSKVVINGFVVTVNAMESACTNVWGLYQAGDRMTDVWNDAMKAEKFWKLGKLGRMTGLSNKLMQAVTRCQKGLEDLIEYLSVKTFDGWVPTYFADTQPMYKEAISEAAEKFGAKSYELFLTDFPSDKCSHYSTPVSSLAKHTDWGATHIRIHTPIAPMKDLRRWFHIEDDRQYVFEKNLPILSAYNDPQNALPGEPVNIMWKSQISWPEKFDNGMELADEGATYTYLGGTPEGPKFGFSIKAADTVGLIMLGSEPPADTVYAMAKQVVRMGLIISGGRALAEDENYDPESAQSNPIEEISEFEKYFSGAHPAEGATAWVFVACGRTTSNTDSSGLYGRVRKLIVEYEEALRLNNLPRYMRIIPFSGQFAIQAYARANVAVIKSGGLTAGEALALINLDKTVRRDTRTGTKLVLINAWSSSARVATRVHEDEPQTAPLFGEEWSNFLAFEGQVEWEGGNAEYLRLNAGAEMACIRPTENQLKRGARFGRRQKWAQDKNWLFMCDLPYLLKVSQQLGLTREGNNETPEASL